MTRVQVAAMAAVSLLLGTWTVTAQTAEPARPPVAAFGAIPAMRTPALSPNGQQVAWIDNSGARPVIEVLDLAKNTRLLRTGADEKNKIRGIEWADDDILLIHQSVTHSVRLSNGKYTAFEWWRINALNVRTRQSRFLLDRPELSDVTGMQLVAPRTTTPKKVLMASWSFSETNYRQETGSHIAGGRKDAGWTYDLFEVDTTTGEARTLGNGTPYTEDWIVGRNGQPVARVEWHPQRQRFEIFHRRDQSYKEIFELETGEQPTVAGVTDDGSALLMFAALGRPHTALWRLPVAGGAPEILLEDSQHEIAAPVLDPYTGQVQGAWLEGLQPKIQWIDERARKRAEGLLKTFNGVHAHVLGRSEDQTRVLVDVFTWSKPSTFYLIDYKRGAADILGEKYPGLENATLGEVQAISYQARDGYEIPAYLTLPAGVEAKQLPLVALPHGGPMSRDEPGFDWLAQFLASRGYAVLQPQFRGSTGFGEAHVKAGYRQWGGLMQDDVTDGVKAMVTRGIADASRICIAGASYGGYSALAGAAFTPELYACAISINGVTDLPMMLKYERSSSGEESDAVAYWSEHIGSHTDENVAAKSPARAADGIRAPILLLHASSDTVVPPEQARVMLKALESKRKPVKFVELPGEDHWLSRGESRIRVLTEMETFLAEHLAPRGKSGS
ncbi:MAG TPA: S9 family peptidase [Steroidobacter sp.]|uniref:alpha/beta hydrolase family protein n=1 Tax=Steroidobacter sp. TaxID=1978227 RepID=UPI002EDAD80C